MKISEILKMHQASQLQAQALAPNLGDGYLLEHNQIYRAIRQQAIALGYIYTRDYNNNYNVFPFMELDEIISSKKIPYFDNVSVLQKLNIKNDKIDWADLAGGLKKNYVFHESAHVVARYVSSQALKNKNDVLLQSLLEESFANTCELLALADVNNQAHKIFFEQNSYTYLPELRQAMRQAYQDFEPRQVFQFICISYLYSNFLKNKISENDQKIIFEIFKIKPQQIKATQNLIALSRVAFTLDYDFKVFTTGLYLKIKSKSADLQTFRLTEALQNEGSIQKWIDESSKYAYA